MGGLDVSKFKKDVKEKKENIPETNEKAKQKAKQNTEAAKTRGNNEIAKKTKEQKEKREKLYPVKVLGVTLYRIKENGEIVFKDPDTDKQVKNLSNWIEKSMNKAVKAAVSESIKFFSEKVTGLTKKERKAAVDKLNSMSRKQIQHGSAEIKDKVEQAVLKAKAILEQKDEITYKVNDNLTKIKYREYISLSSVLPANVRTIVLKRGDESYICVRGINETSGGRIAYWNVKTGKRMDLKTGDEITIVGTVLLNGKEYKRYINRERTISQIHKKRGILWNDKKDIPEKTEKSTKTSYRNYGESGAAYYTAGGRRKRPYERTADRPDEPYSPSRKPLSNPVKKEDLQSTAIEKSPEGFPKNLDVNTVDLPTRRMFCTLVMPKRKPKKGEKIVTLAYLTGKGRSNDYLKGEKGPVWKETPGNLKPPPEVAEMVTKRYLSSQAKRVLSEWIAKMEKKGVYVVCAFMSEIHTDKKNESKTWYNDWNNPRTVQNSFNAVFDAIKKAVPTDEEGDSVEISREVLFAGHSMGGKPAMLLAKYLSEGKVSNMNLRGVFNADSTYWSMNSQIELAEKAGVKLFITAKPGFKTSQQAFNVIKKFELHREGKKTPSSPEDLSEGEYKNEKWPNVVVKITKEKHSKHPQYIADAYNHMAA